MVALGREFIKSVETACREALAELGVERCRGIGTWEIHDDFHGWVGLNTATRLGDGRMLVLPFVGVRCDRIHRLIAEVRGKKYEPHSPPTIRKFMGHLTEHVPATGLEFVKGEDVMPSVIALRNGFEAAGLPYAEQNASLEALVKRIPVDCLREEAAERVLAALYLLGFRRGPPRNS